MTIFFLRLFQSVIVAIACVAVVSAEESCGETAAIAPQSDRMVRRTSVLVRNLSDILWQTPSEIDRTGESRYSWKWLAARHDLNLDGAVEKWELLKFDHLFENLDRNWDGKLTEVDFDWKADSILDRQKETTFALFRTTDNNSDGRLTAEEWQNLFTAASKGQGHLDDSQLERLIFQKLSEMRQKRNQTLAERSQDRWSRLVHSFESGKLWSEGPEPGELAPDFVLRSPDGGSIWKLSAFRNQKPVVLIFGSFT